MTPPAAPGRPLQGRAVLVTRPAEQAAAFARRLEDEGARPILFPAIEIVDAADLGPLFGIIDRLDAFHLAIFISPSAVGKALNLVHARRTWPAALPVAAIGRGSARELERRGFRGVIVPSARFDSEALLGLPALTDVAGRRIVIFRGDGGRELLGDTLAARGAVVEYAECYRRTRPDADAGELLRVWVRGELDAVTVTSSEVLRNLYDMVGRLGQQMMRRTPLFAPHERIAAVARELGIATAVVTGAGDDGLIAGLRTHFAANTMTPPASSPP